MCKITEPINPTPSPNISKPTKHPLLYPTPLRSSKHFFPNTKFFSTSLLTWLCFYHQPSASQPWAAISPRSPPGVTALTDAQAKPSLACWSSSGLHCLSPLHMAWTDTSKRLLMWSFLDFRLQWIFRFTNWYWHESDVWTDEEINQNWMLVLYPWCKRLQDQEAA